MRKKGLILTILTFLFIIPISINSSTITEEYSKCLAEDIEVFRQLEELREQECEIIEQRYRMRMIKGVTFNMDAYHDKLGYYESRGNYKATNRYNYLGKYQFSRNTLNILADKGFLDPNIASLSDDQYLNSISAQERSIEALTTHNLRVLKNYGLLQYIDSNIGGVKITVEGMLAAAHLRGPYAVKQFIMSNGAIDKTDANGTSVSNYIKKFA